MQISTIILSRVKIVDCSSDQNANTVRALKSATCSAAGNTGPGNTGGVLLHLAS